ncbi:MAG: hypothetical protein DCO98_01940 [Altererythrobacter sp. XM-24bin4]|jgi:uncharacterized protein (DUF2141 family)|uniref:DUF2141 domain-containing protein n=1 Tax=Altererythrobacter rubellus TaxID=2173831 RepID=A0A9Y2BA30_9SPHN|nr:DUF2141 domain-containing protein [Altererythrobacter rubellus]PWL25142.1 MAG: hypothetical protein DCO98_01940 [Altererythrobacter sp. XM-24bin4]WIW95780.1 DUF2141 domain-containing protein [Altererythrobacter rubellus]
MRSRLITAGFALTAATLAPVAAAAWAQGAPSVTYRQEISNNMRQCAPGGGPAVRVTVAGIKSSGGRIRVQSYRGVKSDWLERGKWINRIETSAREGTMVFCMPVPRAGTYGIAVRHDVNGNGQTEVSEDGGAMSNNPSINIFNLGKPSYRKTAFEVGEGVTSIRINMRYM